MITGDPVHHGQGGLQLRPTSPLRAQATRGGIFLGESGCQWHPGYSVVPKNPFPSALTHPYMRIYTTQADVASPWGRYPVISNVINHLAIN